MNIEKIAEIIERKFGCYTETANLVAREIVESLLPNILIEACEEYKAAADAAREAARIAIAERDEARSLLAEAREVDSDLTAFANNTGWELSRKCPHFADDDDDEICWIVTEVRGGYNDHEWYVIGKGNTPAEAIRAARSFSEGRGDA